MKRLAAELDPAAAVIRQKKHGNLSRKAMVRAAMGLTGMIVAQGAEAQPINLLAQTHHDVEKVMDRQRSAMEHAGVESAFADMRAHLLPASTQADLRLGAQRETRQGPKRLKDLKL